MPDKRFGRPREILKKETTRQTSRGYRFFHQSGQSIRHSCGFAKLLRICETPSLLRTSTLSQRVSWRERPTPFPGVRGAGEEGDALYRCGRGIAAVRPPVREPWSAGASVTGPVEHAVHCAQSTWRPWRSVAPPLAGRAPEL